LPTGIISHTYFESCEEFTYVLFLIPPFLVVSIVFRLAYGWKAKKAIKSSNPWENFGVDSEIRSYDKKNIKFVLSVTECLLSIISV